MIFEPAVAPVTRVQHTTVPTSAPKDEAVSTGIPEATVFPMATSAVTPPWKRAAAMQTRAAANGRMRRVRIHVSGRDGGPSGLRNDVIFRRDAPAFSQS